MRTRRDADALRVVALLIGLIASVCLGADGATESIVRFGLLALAAMGLGWLGFHAFGYLANGGLLPTLLGAAAFALFIYCMAAWSLLVMALLHKHREPKSAIGLFCHAVISGLLLGLLAVFLTLAG